VTTLKNIALILYILKVIIKLTKSLPTKFSPGFPLCYETNFQGPYLQFARNTEETQLCCYKYVCNFTV